MKTYDDAAQRHNVGWNLTMGLFWIRPWNYLTLDSQSQRYFAKKLGLAIGHSGPKGPCSGNDYLQALETVEARFQEEAYPVHSFPELSYAAWLYKDADPVPQPTPEDKENVDRRGAAAESEDDVTPPPIQAFSVDDILADGCFLGRGRH